MASLKLSWLPRLPSPSAAAGASTSTMQWLITDAIPAAHRDDIVGVQFRFVVDGNGHDQAVEVVKMSGGVQTLHEVLRCGFAQSNGDMRRDSPPGPIFFHDVTTVPVATGTILSINTACDNTTNDIDYRLYVDGYVYKSHMQVGG